MFRAARLLLVLIAAVAFATPGLASEPFRIGYHQQPSISPDGDLIVFSWSGDLWAVKADGGAATRLTTHASHEGRSAFSPCGTMLAFESDREGTRNLFVMPLIRKDTGVVGGQTRRVTRVNQFFNLGSFSACGDYLYFSSMMDRAIDRQPRMYKVPVNGGAIQRITDAFGQMPTAAPDGEHVLFSKGRYQWDRPIYRGSGSMNIFSLHMPSGEFKRYTEFDGNDFDAIMTEDGSVVFVSSRDGQNNLWRLDTGATDAERRRLHQLTRFAPSEDDITIAHGVRHFSASPNAKHGVFLVWDTLYTIDLTDRRARPRAIEVFASPDFDGLEIRPMNISSSASEAVMSPDGKTMAVTTRGEIFVRPTADGRNTRRVTNTAAREEDLAWSLCGTYLYFSADEQGVRSIYRASVSLAQIDLDDGLAPAKPERNGGEVDPLAGEWACTAKGPEPLPEAGVPFTMFVERDGDDYKIRLSAYGLLEAPATDVSISNGSMTFTVTFDGRSASFDLQVDGESLSGTATAEGVTAEITGSRTTRPEPAKEEKKEEEKKDDKPSPGDRWESALRFDTEPLIHTGEHVFKPMPAPDGRRMLYLRDRGDLILRDLATGEDRVIFEWWSEPDVQWLGNSRQIVFSRTNLNFGSDVFLLDLDDPDLREINLSRHPDIDTMPRVSADGKVVAWRSDRRNSTFSYDIWTVFLDKSLEEMPDYEMDAYFTRAARQARNASPIDPPDFSDAGEYEPQDAYELDAEDAWLRLRRLTSGGSSANDVAVTPAGDRILFTARIGSDYSFWSVNPRGGARRTVHSGGVSNVSMNLKGDTVTYTVGGVARSANVTGGGAKTYSIDARIIVDVVAEQTQKFYEAVTTIGRIFYHPTLKDLDWEGKTQRYLQLAQATRTSADFNSVVNMMFGELDGSHLGISGGDSYNSPSILTGFLGVFTEPVEGGHKVTHVIPRSPADADRTRLHEGEVIVAVNEHHFGDGIPDMCLMAALEGTSGREVLLETRTAEGRTRFVLITPMSSGQYSNLMYENEVLDRRRFVEERSGGRIGYLHIQGMNQPSLQTFIHDLFVAADGKEGLLIDVRDNGGGSTTDYLMASLTAPAHAYTVPRGTNPDLVQPDHYPRDRRYIYPYQRPISVLINSYSFSNAEIFAHAVKTSGRGKLVGEATYGGVISTGAFTLIDGSRVRRPYRGWYLPDGTDMENNGAEPDIFVLQKPEMEAKGRDLQLEAAIDEIIERIDASDDPLWRYQQVNDR